MADSQTATEKADERVIDRLTALILTAPQNQRNYTATHDMAAWIVTEARRLGWVIAIEGDK